MWCQDGQSDMSATGAKEATSPTANSEQNRPARLHGRPQHVLMRYAAAGSRASPKLHLQRGCRPQHVLMRYAAAGSRASPTLHHRCLTSRQGTTRTEAVLADGYRLSVTPSANAGVDSTRLQRTKDGPPLLIHHFGRDLPLWWLSRLGRQLGTR